MRDRPFKPCDRPLSIGHGNLKLAVNIDPLGRSNFPILLKADYLFIKVIQATI